MTVNTTDRKTSLTGDGVTLTPFPFSFRLQQTTDLKVYIDDVLQVTGYTVTITAGGVGGYVTFTAAPANGASVDLVREVAYTQGTDFPNTGRLNDTAFENALDKLTLLTQQLAESASRAIMLPLTSIISGLLPSEGSAGQIIRKKLTNDGFELVSALTAFNDSNPAVSAGNVVGPSPSASTNRSLALWDGVGGKTIKDGPALGTAGHGLRSNGSSADPSFSAIGDVFRASGIQATSRTLPTSGALSGTYVHLGNWTSTGALTFAHGTRIYIKGNMTLSHTLTGTAQSNGGGTGSVMWGQAGGGLGGGQGGPYVAAGVSGNGGGGGGSSGAGGNGASNGTTVIVFGGKSAISVTAGGSGGGSGSGNGSVNGQTGGGGGPALYIEVDGNITDNETTAADGAAGTVGINGGGAGGGGGGGTIIKRCTGTYTLAAAKSNSAIGGNGGATVSAGLKGGGGGGGYIEIWSGGAQTISGTNTVAAGTKGTGTAGTTDATDGAAGTTNLIASTAPISLF